MTTKLNPLSFSDFWNRHIDLDRAISYCFTAEGDNVFSGWSTAPWASQHVSTHVGTMVKSQISFKLFLNCTNIP